MLDVHPPHHAVRAWRDFFVHIATIVVGLLIAVGLEQTVEYFHHLHQRAELIADAHEECLQNDPLFAANIALYRSTHPWYLASIAALEDAKPSGGFIDVTLPPGETGTYINASRAVWPLAQTNGKAALLPENLSEVYSLLDFNAGNYQTVFAELVNSSTERRAVYTRLRIAGRPGESLHLTPAARDELVTWLARDDSQHYGVAFRMGGWRGACHAVLAGANLRKAAFDESLRESREAVKP